MKQIGEIMEDIRDMPVCPVSGEVNLYCMIQKHRENEHDTKIYRHRQYDGSNPE